MKTGAPELVEALSFLLTTAEKQLVQDATHEGLTNCEALAAARIALAKTKGVYNDARN